MGCSSSKAVVPQQATGGGGVVVETTSNHKPPQVLPTTTSATPQVYKPPTLPPTKHHPQVYVPPQQCNSTTNDTPPSVTTSSTVGASSDGTPGSFVNPTAAAMYIQAKRAGEAVLAGGDPGHKEAAKGDELRDKKEFRLAFKQYEYALTMRKSKLGGTEKHGLIADAYAKMGVCRTGEGYTDLGWKLHMQALQMRRELFGEGSGPVGESLGYLGDTLVAMNNFRDARCQYQEAIEIRTKAGDTTSPQTAQYYASLGNCHRMMQDFDQALECLQKARKSFEMFLGPNHGDTINCWFVIALIYQEQGQYEQAMLYHQAALQARERIHGPNSVLASASYMNVGLVQKSLGQLDQAQANLLKSLQIRTSRLGTEHEETALCVANLGNLMMAKKEYSNATALYQKAQQALENGVGLNHPFTWNVYCKVAECHRAQAQHKQALEYYDKALTIAFLVFGTKSKQASSVRIWTAQTKLESLDIAGALEGFRQAYKLDMAIRPKDPTTAKIGQLLQTMESALVNK